MPPLISIPTGSGMFHTFQGVTPRKSSIASTYSPKDFSSGNKRITTPHACAECKRRKIRCDGKQPCGQCLSSRAPKRCFYDKHRQRVIPSRKTLEALSQSLEECRSILKRLYPDHDASTLLPLSRPELLSLLGYPFTESSIALPSPPLNSTTLKKEPPRGSDRTLTIIEQIPPQTSESDEERRNKDPIPLEADDVNALSLSIDRQTSYLGASSIKAALLVMLKVQPHLRESISPSSNSFEPASTLSTLRQRIAPPEAHSRISWSWKGQTLIDAYFKRVHVFVPMLDEPAFRKDYLEGKRVDSPWISLLNVVFAMGSIAASKSDDSRHTEYYQKAMEHLSLESLGSSHIETVQALSLIGGYYLHYVNRPNMANAILGAALRMATALGLHRQSQVQSSDDAGFEARGRTWWSLFCLDTWATTTLGRPGSGKYGPEVNVRLPEVGVDGANYFLSETDGPSSLLPLAQNHEASQHVGVLPLVENIKFCQIASKVQDMLAVAPVLKPEDRRNLDNQLVNWYNNLPWILRSTDPCAEPLFLSRCIMKWRYQNLRMLLYRPVLLSMATNDGNQRLDGQDLTAVATCRDMAKQTIEDISREWSGNQISGWNAAWFLYQAVMVPLVSIHWQWASPLIPGWQIQVETVLDLLDSMKDWSLSARRSREVVRRLYESRRQYCNSSPLSSNGTNPGISMGDIDLQISSLELDSDDLMDVLGQHGNWDPDGMYWGQSSDPLSTECEMYSIGNGSMMHTSHGSISFGGSNMESAFLV